MRSAPSENPSAVTPDDVRMLPWDADAERIVLGCCLRSESRLDEAEFVHALLTLDASDFYHEASRTIYSAICEVWQLGQPVATPTVARRLGERNQLEANGGREFLRKLASEVWSASQVREAIRAVAGKSRLRQMIAWTEEAREELHTREHEPDAVIADLASEALRFANAQDGPMTVTPDATQEEDWGQIVAALQANYEVTPARFGVGELDRYTGGLGNMFLVLLMAMQGSGKTRFAMHATLTSAQQFARLPEEDRPYALVFPLEEGREPWVRNAVAWLAGVDAMKLMPGRARKDEREDLRKRAEAAHAKLRELPVVIGQNVTRIDQLTMLIQIEARRRKLGLVVIDYLQRLGRTAEEERRALGEVSLDLQTISERLGVPILLLSQMSFSNVPGEVLPYGGRGAAFDASLALILERTTDDNGKKLDAGSLTCFKARPIPEFPAVSFHVSYKNGGHYYDEREWADVTARERVAGTRLEVPRDERYG